MTGIYKITSPSGKLYIGQTRNFERRVKDYKRLKFKAQVHLYNSFMKYGYNSHKFQIINELPIDISQKDLDNHEIIYISQYRNCYILMNISDGGQGSPGKRIINLTPEQRLNKRNKMLGNTYSLGYIQSDKTKIKRVETRRRNRARIKRRIFLGLNPYL